MNKERRDKMEQMLQTILEEIKGLKGEVQGIKGEVKDSKTELREEMQEMKTGMQEEMDKRFAKQSKEIAEELNKIVILQERRDNRLESKINLALEIQTEILKDIRKIKIEQKEYDYRISKLEYEQKNTQEKLEKVS